MKMQPQPPPPTCETQRSILGWGSHAVQLMTTGSYREASQAWTRALLQLLPHLQGPALDDAVESVSSGDLSKQAVDVTCHMVSTDEDRVFSVFTRSILYTRNDSNQRLWTLEDYRRVAASTVYNLALTHHLQGLQGAGSKKDLDKALQAYKSARDLLSLTPSEAATAPEDLRLLYLAIANNEGHIRELAFEADRVAACLQQLHEVLPHTWWVNDFSHFHETAVLFPIQASLSFHAPIA